MCLFRVGHTWVGAQCRAISRIGQTGYLIGAFWPGSPTSGGGIPIWPGCILSLGIAEMTDLVVPREGVLSQKVSKLCLDVE